MMHMRILVSPEVKSFAVLSSEDILDCTSSAWLYLQADGALTLAMIGCVWFQQGC